LEAFSFLSSVGASTFSFLEAPADDKKMTTSKKEKVEAPTEDKKEKASKKEKVEAPSEDKKEKASKKEDKETPAEDKKEEAPVEVEKQEAQEYKDEIPPSEEKSEEAPGEKRVPNTEDLIFGMYNTAEVVVEDPSLKAHINLEPAYVPHSSARHANKPFYKSKISIVERLANSMMRTERFTGKKTKSYKAVKDAFEIINRKTKQNPVQVLVQAIENSAPREEVTRLKFGGISVPKAVDAGPSRRLDIALRNIAVGTVKASHKNKKSISACLAGELIAASNGDIQSFAVSKRDEIERVAKSAH
jgi:small subunit ribosomal protein S7